MPAYVKTSVKSMAGYSTVGTERVQGAFDTKTYHTKQIAIT